MEQQQLLQAPQEPGEKHQLCQMTKEELRSPAEGSLKGTDPCPVCAGYGVYSFVGVHQSAPPGKSVILI